MTTPTPTTHGTTDTGSGAGRSLDRLVVAYLRVSTEPQDMERQEAQVQLAEVEHPGVEVLALREDGVSAYKVSIFDRPRGKELCDLIVADRVEAVYADAQDRLSRGRLAEWVNFKALCDDHGTAIVINGRQLRADDEADEMLAAFEAMRARRESAEKSHRVKGGKAKKARQGRPNGGLRRYGFEKGSGKSGVLVPVPAEVAVVERIFRARVNGDSQTDIAKALDKDGIRTAYGKPWTQTLISHVLRDPVWIGKVRSKQGVVDGKHGELIPRELWDKAQATLVKGKRGRGKRSTRFLLGNGLLRCGRCGEAMRVCRYRSGDESYRCFGRDSRKTCDMPNVRREDIDPQFLAYWEREVIDVDGTVAQLARTRERRLGDVQARAEQARAVITQAELRLARTDADYHCGELTAAEWKHLREAPERERETATGALSDLANEEQAILTQDVLLDATSEVVAAITDLRAQVAGELNEATDLQAAQTAIRRVFGHVELHQLEGKVFLLPAVRADMLADPTGYELVKPRQVAVDFGVKQSPTRPTGARSTTITSPSARRPRRRPARSAASTGGRPSSSTAASDAVSRTSRTARRPGSRVRPSSRGSRSTRRTTKTSNATIAAGGRSCGRVERELV